MSDQFVACTFGGSGAATSPDGITWTARSMPSSANWQVISRNASVYCAIAVVSGTCATSPDGITWTAQSMPSSSNWRSIAWNGSVFCAVADTTIAATSPDGITWTAQTLPSSGTWISLAWNGTVFCAIAYGGTAAATSANGASWTSRTLPASANWREIAWNGSVFCAIAYGSANAATSPDGITWTLRTLPSSTNWVDIAWNGSVFCAISETGTTAATSPDGITWTRRTLAVSGCNSIAWNGSVFCAVAGTTNANTSPDGITWTARSMPSSGTWQGAIGTMPYLIGAALGSVGVSATSPTLDTGSNGVDVSSAAPILGITHLPTTEVECAAPAPILYAESLVGADVTVDIAAPATQVEIGWASVDLAAPAPTFDTTLLVGGVVTVTAVAATPLLLTDAINPAIITADMAALPPQLSAAIAAGNVIEAALLARAPALQAQALTGAVGALILGAATPIMAAAGYPAYIVMASVVASPPYLSATVVAALSANYRTWALNTRRGALTEYNAFEFNSYAVFNGKVVAAGPAGLVEIGLQSDDAGVPINSTVTTGQESFGSSEHKRVPRAYTSYSTDGDMRFSTITTEGGTRTYALDWNHLHGIQQRRVPVGKGPKSRFWQFSVTNVGGADFSLNDVLVMPTKLRRRVM